MRLLYPLAIATLPVLVGCCPHTEVVPAAPCYSGTVLGFACMDGLVIEVDAQYPIGRPTSSGNNIIGALNVAQIGSLGKAGQRLYFTCSGDTTGYANFSVCPQNTIPANIPHVVLRAFSATACPTGSR